MVQSINTLTHTSTAISGTQPKTISPTKRQLPPWGLELDNIRIWWRWVGQGGNLLTCTGGADTFHSADVRTLLASNDWAICPQFPWAILLPFHVHIRMRFNSIIKSSTPKGDLHLVPFNCFMANKIICWCSHVTKPNYGKDSISTDPLQRCPWVPTM